MVRWVQWKWNFKKWRYWESIWFNSWHFYTFPQHLDITCTFNLVLRPLPHWQEESYEQNTSFKFYSFLAVTCWQQLIKKSMTATNSAFCNTSHNTYGSGKCMYKKILRNYLLPHLPLRRFVGLLNNQTLQKCSLIHLVFTILAILTSFKSKSSSNNYLLSWKHMNYTFMPFSMYMVFFL